MHIFDHGKVFEIFAWKIILKYSSVKNVVKVLFTGTPHRKHSLWEQQRNLYGELVYCVTRAPILLLRSSVALSFKVCPFVDCQGRMNFQKRSKRHLTLVGQLNYSSAPSNIFVDFSLPSPAWLSSTAWWTSGSVSRYASSSTRLSSPVTTEHSPKITWKVRSDLTCWIKNRPC